MHRVEKHVTTKGHMEIVVGTEDQARVLAQYLDRADSLIEEDLNKAVNVVLSTWIEMAKIHVSP
jgi:hypothetical protein